MLLVSSDCSLSVQELKTLLPDVRGEILSSVTAIFAGLFWHYNVCNPYLLSVFQKPMISPRSLLINGYSSFTNAWDQENHGTIGEYETSGAEQPVCTNRLIARLGHPWKPPSPGRPETPKVSCASRHGSGDHFVPPLVNFRSHVLQFRWAGALPAACWPGS